MGYLCKWIHCWDDIKRRRRFGVTHSRSYKMAFTWDDDEAAEEKPLGRQLPNGNVYRRFMQVALAWLGCCVRYENYVNLYLNIWTLDRANPPRFVPWAGWVSGSECMELVAVHCAGISRATTDDNHTRTDCRRGEGREAEACSRTFRGASWWCCCCWASRSPARVGSWRPSRRCTQSDCGPTEGCEVPERPWTFASISLRFHYLINRCGKETEQEAHDKS